MADPEPVTILAPGLRRVIAPNPSPMTQWGTNTYLIGGPQGLCVLDPGPDDRAHLERLRIEIGTSPVTAIVVTHAHLDHSALAPTLALATGAPVLAWGDADAGRSPVMAQLVADGMTGGGEGIDRAFRPDRIIVDGEEIDGPGWSLRVIHTPGHTGNHIALAWNDAVFCGDHVMGWASSLVSPPDGDLTQFMASCARLLDLGPRTLHPGHGAPVTDPAARLHWLIAHRRGREAQILARLAQAAAPIPALTRAIYTDIPAALLPAAERNVLAHLIDLQQRSLAQALGHPATAPWTTTPRPS